MIHEGTDIKWMVTVEMDGYSIDDDDMELVIKNRYGQVKYSYKAEDFYTNGNGMWLFNMPNARRGSYYAFMTCWRGDEDFPDNFQKVTDVRHLVDVGICGCAKDTCHCCQTDGMKVTYTRVWTVNFQDGIYLADKDGNPIRDVNGELIRFSDRVPERKDVRINMTADEFKHWMDDRDENGTIDTRHEIEDALGGFDDNTELSVMTTEDTSDMMSRILGTNNKTE